MSVQTPNMVNGQNGQLNLTIGSLVAATVIILSQQSPAAEPQAAKTDAAAKPGPIPLVSKVTVWQWVDVPGCPFNPASIRMPFRVMTDTLSPQPTPGIMVGGVSGERGWSVIQAAAPPADASREKRNLGDKYADAYVTLENTRLDPGTYAGTIDLTPNNPDDKASVELTVNVSHHWPLPVLTLLAGVLVFGLAVPKLEHRFARAKLETRWASFENEVKNFSDPANEFAGFTYDVSNVKAQVTAILSHFRFPQTFTSDLYTAFTKLIDDATAEFALFKSQLPANWKALNDETQKLIAHLQQSQGASPEELKKSKVKLLTLSLEAVQKAQIPAGAVANRFTHWEKLTAFIPLWIERAKDIYPHLKTAAALENQKLVPAADQDRFQKAHTTLKNVAQALSLVVVDNETLVTMDKDYAWEPACQTINELWQANKPTTYDIRTPPPPTPRPAALKDLLIGITAYKDQFGAQIKMLAAGTLFGTALFLLSLAVGLLTALLTLYVNKPFGMLSDYVSLFIVSGAAVATSAGVSTLIGRIVND